MYADERLLPHRPEPDPAGAAPAGAQRRATNTRRPPGPRGHLFKGNLPDFWHDPLSFITRCARTYGDVVAMRLGPRLSFQLNHPDDIEAVLVTNNRNFIKHPGMSMNRYLLGNGLLVNEGESWLRQRRIAQPAFHRDRLVTYGESMVRYAEQMLATWRDGETRDVHTDMMLVTVKIVVETLFGVAMADAEARAVDAAQQEVMDAFYARYNSIFFLLTEKVPTRANLRMKRAAQQLDNILRRTVLQHRDTTRDHDALLSLLLANHVSQGGHMTDTQLRDEVMNVFLAGHETSASALSWTWYLLAQHPEMEVRLHAELQDVLGGRAPTVADLPRLQYTEMVVKEALRLLPPLWFVGRTTLQACGIGGYQVPAGTLLQMYPWVVHRDPRYYGEPDAFRPERWAGDFARRLPRFAYFPFGGGARQCIGNTFAMMEIVLVVATVAQRYRLALAPDYSVTPVATMTLRPAHGMKMVLQHRAPHSAGGRVGSARNATAS